MITGLTRPDAGSATVAGKPFADLPNPARTVGTLLDAVGLSGDADRRVGTYSLGMRQRLGLAHALVGEPSVLILDEPANGLDPEGIAWIRTLLRDFAAGGGTVLLSSHLLAEVQATADHPTATPFARLFRAEFRKATDTRAARWLLAAAVLLALAAQAVPSCSHAT